MKFSVHACFVSVFLLFCSAGIFAQTSGRANFGNYPADYKIAYTSMVGFSNALTARTLFGPNAFFVTSFQDMPAIVTVESSSGTRERFTVQLLVTLKVPEKGDTKFVRMQVTLESDSMSEMSYIRYVKMVNMVNGQTSEKRSMGDERSDGNVVGFFIGMMEIFWDTSKYK